MAIRTPREIQGYFQTQSGRANPLSPNDYFASLTPPPGSTATTGSTDPNNQPIPPTAPPPSIPAGTAGGGMPDASQAGTPPQSDFQGELMKLFTAMQGVGTGGIQTAGNQAMVQQGQAGYAPLPGDIAKLGLDAGQIQQFRQSQTGIYNPQIQGAGNLAQTVSEQLKGFSSIVTGIQDYEKQKQQFAADSFNKMATQFGGDGIMAYAAQDPKGFATMAKSMQKDPAALLSMAHTLSLKERQQAETARIAAERSQQAQQRLTILTNSQGSLNTQRDARAQSSYAAAIKSITTTLWQAGKNPLEIYNSSSQNINRIDQALKQAKDPKQPSKGAADLELVDAYISIARGGQAITEAQVDTLLRSQGLQGKFDVATQKLIGIDTLLTNNQRDAIGTLAKSVFSGQKKLANQGVSTINKYLKKKGFPDNQMLSAPEDALIGLSDTGGDTSSTGNSGNSDTGSTRQVNYKGKLYNVDASGNMTPAQ